VIWLESWLRAKSPPRSTVRPENVFNAGGRVDREHAMRRTAGFGLDEPAARAR
jgi:hypothetical protein